MKLTDVHNEETARKYYNERPSLLRAYRISVWKWGDGVRQWIGECGFCWHYKFESGVDYDSIYSNCKICPVGKLCDDMLANKVTPSHVHASLIADKARILKSEDS
jgi:hypothetical protein